MYAKSNPVVLLPFGTPLSIWYFFAFGSNLSSFCQVRRRGTISGTGEILRERDILETLWSMACHRSRRFLDLRFYLLRSWKQHSLIQLLLNSSYLPIIGAVACLVLSLFQSTLLLHCHGAMSHSSHATKPAQIIEGEYLDPQKLMRLLNQKYGPSEGSNFRVEVWRHR